MKRTRELSWALDVATRSVAPGFGAYWIASTDSSYPSIAFLVSPHVEGREAVSALVLYWPNDAPLDDATRDKFVDATTPQGFEQLTRIFPQLLEGES